LKQAFVQQTPYEEYEDETCIRVRVGMPSSSPRFGFFLSDYLASQKQARDKQKLRELDELLERQTISNDYKIVENRELAKLRVRERLLTD
jgi:hypothetical protein